MYVSISAWSILAEFGVAVVKSAGSAEGFQAVIKLAGTVAQPPRRPNPGDQDPG